MKIGVLDIQGSVEEHFAVLEKLAKKYSFTPVLVKAKADIVGLSGLIIPGGESTVIGKLLVKFGLDKAIKLAVKNGMAVWGTCAGAILLARKVMGDDKIHNLNLIDIDITRNAYGRQVDSFETQIKFNQKNIPAIFIRAPKIVRVGKNIDILARYEDEVVAVQKDKILITTFHPELTSDMTVHEYFIKMCN